MQIELFEKAETDFEFWNKSGNKIIQKEIQILLEDRLLHPLPGIGKAEMLINGLEELMKNIE